MPTTASFAPATIGSAKEPTSEVRWMDMRCNTKPITVVIIAAGLGFASCGGDDTADQVTANTGGNDAGPVATTTSASDEMDDATAPEAPTPGTTDLAPSTSAGPIEPDAPARSPRWLASVTTEPRGPDGWLVPAGDWTTAAFATPVTFTTTSDLILIGEYSDLVVFADPARPDTPGLLYLARAAFLKQEGSTGPIPSSPDEITEFIEAQPDVDLVASGMSEPGGVAWWDIAVGNFSDGAPYGCVLGDTCGPVAFSDARVAIDTLESETTRIYRTDIGGTRIGAYVTGHSQGREPLLEIADGIVTSLGRDQPTDPPPENDFFGLLGPADRSIPAGTYVARFPDATLTFEFADDLDDFEVVLSKMNTIWITTSTAGLGLLPARWLIDPAADQRDMTGVGETVFSYVDPAVETTDEFLAWSAAMRGTPIAPQSESVGGLDLVLIIEEADDRTANTQPCDPPNEDADCFVGFTSDGVPWISEVDGPDATDDQAEGWIGFIEDAGIVVSVVSLDGSGLDAAKRELAPLLDSLSITPVGKVAD